MNTTLNISVARLAHLNWTMALESMVLNPQHSVEIQSYQDCELGHWIYTTGLHSYSNFDATNLLVRTHKHFHEVAHEMVENKLEDKKLEQKMRDMLLLSRDIVYFLTELELNILEFRHQKETIAHPFRSLVSRLFNGPHHALPDEQGPLNVSYARLVHLNWVRSLNKSFRGWGHNAHLESEEDCSLGSWLNSTGTSLSEKHIEIGHLETIHKEFHVSSRKTIYFLRHRRESAAQKSYTKTLELSRKIIYILSIIELKLLDSGVVVREEVFV
ncbi:conserved hypothetical protein [Gammaproteobacteria bacterium]